MQEVFRKIIYALEEYKYNDLIDRDSEMCNHCKRIDCENGTDCSLCIMDKAIEIVKKAAVEHGDNWIPCSYQLGYSKAIDDILHKLNDTGFQITFDLPVEEILGEDVDLDDFAMLMNDAIRAYRKMVIGTIEQMK